MRHVDREDSSRSDQTLTGRRIAFVTTAPAPYRDMLYRHLTDLGASVRVYYTRAATRDRRWAVDDSVSSERLARVVAVSRFGQFHRGLLRVVRSADVVVVGGYHTLTYVVAMLLGRATGRRVVMFFDGVAPSRLGRRGVGELCKRALVRLPHHVLANGTVGRRYMVEHLRVPSQRVFNQYLVPVPMPRLESHEPEFDAVFVGRLLPRKRADLVVAAAQLEPTMRWCIVGDGPESSALRAADVDGRVTFLGELARPEVAGVIGRSRSVVMPSEDEPWGLVVQESLEMGRPVVVSVDAGCAADLIRDGENGVVLRELTPQALLDGVRRALGLADQPAMARANSEILSTWTRLHYCQAFARAVG